MLENRQVNYYLIVSSCIRVINSFHEQSEVKVMAPLVEKNLISFTNVHIKFGLIEQNCLVFLNLFFFCQEMQTVMKLFTIILPGYVILM